MNLLINLETINTMTRKEKIQLAKDLLNTNQIRKTLQKHIDILTKYTGINYTLEKIKPNDWITVCLPDTQADTFKKHFTSLPEPGFNIIIVRIKQAS